MDPHLEGSLRGKKILIVEARKRKNRKKRKPLRVSEEDTSRPKE